MVPFGMSAISLARACHVPRTRTRIERIAREEIGITADTALRPAKVFGNSAQFWLNLQTRHDVETAAEALGGDLDRIERHFAPVA